MQDNQPPDPLRNLWDCFLPQFVPLLPTIHEEIHRIVFSLNPLLEKQQYPEALHALLNLKEFFYSGVGLTSAEIRELVLFAYAALSNKCFFKRHHDIILLIIDLVQVSLRVPGLFGIPDSYLTCFSTVNDADFIFGTIHKRDDGNPLEGLVLDYRTIFNMLTSSDDLPFDISILVFHFKNFFPSEDAPEILKRVELFPSPSNGLRRAFLLYTLMPAASAPLFLRAMLDRWQSVYTSDALDYFHISLLSDVLSHTVFPLTDTDINFIFDRINHDLFYEFNGGDGALDGITTPFKGLSVLKTDQDDFSLACALLIIQLIKHTAPIHPNPIMQRLKVFFESVHRSSDDDVTYSVVCFLKSLAVFFHQGHLEAVLDAESRRFFVEIFFETLRPIFFADSLTVECKDIIRWLLEIDGATFCELFTRFYGRIISAQLDRNHLKTYMTVITLFINILPQLIRDGNDLAINIITLVFDLFRSNPTIPDVFSIAVDLFVVLSDQFYLVDTPPPTVSPDSLEYSIFLLLSEHLVEFFKSVIVLFNRVSSYEAFPFTNLFYNIIEGMLLYDSSSRRAIEENLLEFVHENTTLPEPFTIILTIFTYHSDGFSNKLIDYVASRLLHQTDVELVPLELSENETLFCLSLLGVIFSRTDFLAKQPVLFAILDHYVTHPNTKLSDQALDCCKRIASFADTPFTIPPYVSTPQKEFASFADLDPSYFTPQTDPPNHAFFQAFYDHFVLAPLTRLVALVELPDVEFAAQRKSVHAALTQLTILPEFIPMIYDISGHNVTLPEHFLPALPFLRSHYTSGFTWEELGVWLIAISRKVRRVFENDNQIVSRCLVLLRGFIRKQGTFMDPLLMSFLIHPTRRTYTAKLHTIVMYGQATCILTQLQLLVYQQLFGEIEVQVFLEEQALAPLFCDGDFNGFVLQTSLVKHQHCERILSTLIDRLPTTVTRKTAESYVFTLRMIGTYFNNIPIQHFSYFFRLVARFFESYLHDPGAFVVQPLGPLIGQFEFIAKQAPIFLLPEIPEDFLALTYRACAAHPLIHRFLITLMSSFIFRNNSLPPSYITHALRHLTAPHPHPKRYSASLAQFISKRTKRPKEVIVYRDVAVAAEYLAVETKYRPDVFLVAEHDVLCGELAQIPVFVASYTTKFSACARFKGLLFEHTVPPELVEMFSSFLLDTTALTEFIELLELCSRKSFEENAEQEAKYINLSDFFFLLRLMNLFGATAGRIYLDIAHAALVKKTRDDSRIAVVLFQIVVESLHTLSAIEVAEFQQRLGTLFAEILRLQFEDVLVYVNRLNALFVCRMDPRLVRNLVQIAVASPSPLAATYLLNAACMRLDLIPQATVVFLRVLDAPNEALNDAASNFGSKMLLTSLTFPSLTFSFLQTLRTVLLALPESSTTSGLPLVYRIATKIFYPSFDQAITFQQPQLDLLYIVLDKLLHFSKSSIQVMDDVVEFFTNLSSIIVHPTCYAAYLQHYLDLLVLHSENQNAFSLLVQSLTVIITVHCFQMTSELVALVLAVALQILQSPQTQIRLFAYDLLFALIDIFHPVDLVVQHIALLQQQASSAGENVQHAYVLASAALITSYKTTIPPFLVRVLVDLAQTEFSSACCVTSKRTAMQEFWKAHKDMWDAYYAPLFTFEERCLLRGNNAPSYLI